jgi:tetratricopeptide (TPR) repeat protein
MPEKELQAIPRPLRDQYEKGLAAIHRENLDYAIAILNAVLRQEPAFYKCREALRATQFKRAGKKGGFIKRLFGTASHSPLLAKGQLALRSNPLDALVTAEHILNSDPHSLPAHRLLAEAALAADLPRTAVLSLEIVFKNAPDRAAALRLAEALAKTGQIARGESILVDLAATFPTDAAVQQALKDVSARRTLSEDYQKLQDGSGSYRDILKDKVEAAALEQQDRQVTSEESAHKALADIEARLANEPLNPRLLRSAAELYSQQKQFDRALACYQQIVTAQGVAEPSIERSITLTTVRRYDHQIELLDPTAPDYETQRAQLEAEQRDYTLAQGRNLADRYPNDLQIRFDLGLLYFKIGKLNEAIQEFQKAQANPHRRIQALSLLGQCFAQRGLHDLAARTFQTAIREKEIFDSEKKELVYELAGVLNTMGKPDEAIEQYKLIYEIDIGYRDVAAKIDNYYNAKQSDPL